jgi:TolB-like protein/Flp pilus assembly protein TadD
MLRLRLKVLGGFEARIGPGEPLDIATRKARALLAYLALPLGRTHARDKLTGLLWSDRGDEQARNSLRQALTELGRILTGIEPTPLIKGRDTLSLDPEAVEVDAMLFERLATSPDAGDLRRAAAMYAGDLLDGFGVRDPAFEEWLRDERQRYRELAVANLKTLVTCQTGANALAVAQRLLALAPLQEEVHRTAMRLHAEAGDIAAALRQYETCCATLKRELNITPSPETEALHRRIRDQATARPDRDYIAASAKDLREPPMAGRSRPSIAVLPFRNLSGDPEQQYFSDGITEDIITELSRFRSLFVIARNSSFQFRDESLDVKGIGHDLGVEYVVEGSVRKAENRVRITAQLIEVATGSHLWSDRYDRDLADVFAVQDDVVQAIVAVLPSRIAEAGARSARRKRPENMQAYDYLLRGIEHLLRWDRGEDHSTRDMFDAAVALAPEWGAPYAWLAWITLRQTEFDPGEPALDEAYRLGQRAVSLDENDSVCHLALGEACLYRRQLDDAAYHINRAMTLNPNDPGAALYMGVLSAYLGRLEEAESWVAKAFQLNPYPSAPYNVWQGLVSYAAREYDEAIAAVRKLTAPQPWELMYLAASYGQLGRQGEGQAALARYRALRPGKSVLEHAATEPFKNVADLNHLLDGLRKAGLLE